MGIGFWDVRNRESDDSCNKIEALNIGVGMWVV